MAGRYGSAQLERVTVATTTARSRTTQEAPERVRSSVQHRAYERRCSARI